MLVYTLSIDTMHASDVLHMARRRRPSRPGASGISAVLPTFWLSRLRPCSKHLAHRGAIAGLRPRIIGFPARPGNAGTVPKQSVGQTPAAILWARPGSTRLVQPGRR